MYICGPLSSEHGTDTAAKARIQGQILALTFTYKSLAPLKLFPLGWEAVAAIGIRPPDSNPFRGEGGDLRAVALCKREEGGGNGGQ